VVWTLWHAPLGIVEIGVVGWATDLPIHMLNVVRISLVATLVYNNTDGSGLLTVVLHAGINGAQPLYPVAGMFTPSGELARLLAWRLLVVVILLTYGWQDFSRGDLPPATRAGARPGLVPTESSR